MIQVLFTLENQKNGKTVAWVTVLSTYHTRIEKNAFFEKFAKYVDMFPSGP